MTFIRYHWNEYNIHYKVNLFSTAPIFRHRGKIEGFRYSSEKAEDCWSNCLFKMKPKKRTNLFMIVVLVGQLSVRWEASELPYVGRKSCTVQSLFEPHCVNCQKNLLYLHVLFTLFSLFLPRDACLELLDVWVFLRSIFTSLFWRNWAW